MSATKIYQYIEARKFAPARSLLDTELASDPNSCVYNCLAALMAFKLNQRATAISTVEKVVASKKLTTVLITNLISPILLGYNLPKLLNTAFEQVNRILPQDKALVSTWIECALILGNPRMLSKALLANNKQQQSRKSAFQTAFSLHLVFQGCAPQEPERKLYPALAARMLEPHLPARSKNEFYTHVMVTSMSSSIAPLLENKEMSTDLTLQQVFIDDLVNNEQWDLLWDYSRSILDQIDTFNSWQALNTAAVKLGRVDQAREYINAYTKSNNAQLAAVDLVEKSDPGALIAALRTYWESMQHKACAYEYLKPYTSHADFSKVISPGEPSGEPKTFVGKVNRIKLEYHLNPQVDTASLVQLYQAHLNELPVESTDYFIGSDLLILGAIQLLKKGQHFEALLLLEYACSNDKSNFYIRLWLMKLYRYFGCISLVQHQYETLSIKNLQHESLGHYLALHGGSLGLEAKKLTALKAMYEQSDEMSTATQMALENQVFCQIPSMLELQRKMNASLARALFNIEEIKSQRVNRGETDMTEIVNMTGPLADNRDLRTFFDPLGEAPSLGFTDFEPEYVQSLLDRENLFLARIRNTSPLQEVSKIGLSAAEKWSMSCFEENKLLPLPEMPANTFSEEFVHTIYTAIETIKLLSDISLKQKKKPDYRQERKHLLSLVEAALEEESSFADPLAWAVKHSITGAEPVVAALANSRNQVLVRLATLLK